MKAKKKNQKHYKVDAQQVQMRFFQQATPMGPVAPNAPMFQGPTAEAPLGTVRNINPFAFTPFAAVNPFQFAPGVIGPFGLPVGRIQPTPISPQEFQRRQEPVSVPGALGLPPEVQRRIMGLEALRFFGGF
ncbi:hypothetical protein [Tumebacillus lipolyticus]|uniref:Spore coat protein n=1 Tax=Tumebacillus lipolyticus TaxID=1280370 RepID=A0ABW4ZWM0_9BACL